MRESVMSVPLPQCITAFWGERGAVQILSFGKDLRDVHIPQCVWSFLFCFGDVVKGKQPAVQLWRQMSSTEGNCALYLACLWA